MKRATVFAATLLAVSPSPSFAQTLDDLQAAEAVLAAARKKMAEADEALMKVWEATPLTFRNVAFTEGEPEGFRKFTPRADTSFKTGDLLVSYAEAVGYGWRENGDGTYTIEFDVDFAVKNAEGKIIAAEEKFDHIEVLAKSRNRNFQITLTMRFNDVQPGDYTLQYSVLDKHEGETAVISLPFSVVE